MSLPTFLIAMTVALFVLALFPQTRPMIRQAYRVVVLIPQIAILVAFAAALFCAVTNSSTIVGWCHTLTNLAQVFGRK
jgi:hypothetical protein